MQTLSPATKTQSPAELRSLIRRGDMAANTSGFTGGYVQCNVVILPAQWATDFMQFCQLNPRPCPLIASSSTPSDTALPALGDIDIRKDVLTYRVYEHGELKREVNDITTL